MSAYLSFNLSAAVILALYAAYILKKQNLKWRVIITFSIVMIIVFFIGSRVLYALLYLDRILEEPSKLFEIRLVNFSLYGGLILCAGLWLGFVKKYKLKFWKISDLMAPVLGISIALSKMGCFLNGCCYGIPTSLPWGMIFERADLTPAGKIFSGAGPLFNLITGSAVVYRHPTQLYEVAFALLASTVALIIQLSFKSDDTKYLKTMGLPTLSFIIIFTIGRFLSFTLREFPYASSTSNMIRGPILYGIILITSVVSIIRRLNDRTS